MPDADATRPAGPFRVGSVPYLVARPLDAALADAPGVALSHAPPARLVDGLRSGELDCALVSSIELFRRPGYRYLDGPGIFGDGPVSSVQLFLRRPAARLRRVALDPASRASAALVRVLLANRFDARPEWLEVERGADPRAADADAWLRIGDPALRERVLEPELDALDPAAEWKAWTGLPFPFALWIARPGVALERLAPALAAAADAGLARLREFAAAGAAEWGLPLADTERYLLEECRYAVHGGPARALARFRALAAEEGLCDAGPEPEAVAVP